VRALNADLAAAARRRETLERAVRRLRAVVRRERRRAGAQSSRPAARELRKAAVTRAEGEGTP
jgi:hypothetical protein